MEKAELLSKFSDLKKIKKGGQKIVYLAQNQESQQVALKIINDAADPRVLQEISIVQDIQLDNVPRIFESGTVTDNSVGEEALYIVEEYIDGISMRDWLNQGHTANLPLAFNRVNPKFCVNSI